MSKDNVEGKTLDLDGMPFLDDYIRGTNERRQYLENEVERLTGRLEECKLMIQGLERLRNKFIEALRG